MKTLNNLLFAFCCLFLFISCDNDECCVPPPAAAGPDVWISCEGNFGVGNARVDLFVQDSTSLIPSVFKMANGRSPGDVLQHIAFFNDAYLVMNGSGRLERIDMENQSLKATISGFNSPRHMLILDNSTAWVSSLFGNKIYVVDLSINSISDTIAFNGWSEIMLKHNDEVIISNPTLFSQAHPSDKIYIYEAGNQALVDSVLVGHGSASMVLDKEENVWVYCDGDFLDPATGGIYQVNVSSRSVIKSFPFTEFTPRFTNKLLTNLNRDTLYFTAADGIYRMPITASDLPSEAFIKDDTSDLYGLGISPKDGLIYVSDAKGFQQEGSVRIFNSEGMAIDSFSTGVGPNGFYFR
jgi:DNA-binding beta-propeller fold protein YncE